MGAYPGEKESDGECTGRYSIVFLVSKKLKNPTKKIPKYYVVDLPELGKKRIPTDIVETQKYQLRSANLGDKIKRKNLGEFGTNGMFLVKEGQVFACTNAHVLLPDMISANETHFFKPLSDQTFPDVTLIGSDGTRSNAHLQEGFFNGIDAAIARMDDPNDVENRIPGSGKPAGIKVIQSDDVGMQVQMQGLVSGKSKGKVLKVGLTIPTSIPEVFLHDLVETSIISRKGDSGSPVLNAARRITGIIIGGTATTTLVVPIDKILGKFECDLLT